MGVQSRAASILSVDTDVYEQELRSLADASFQEQRIRWGDALVLEQLMEKETHGRTPQGPSISDPDPVADIASTAAAPPREPVEAAEHMNSKLDLKQLEKMNPKNLKKMLKMRLKSDLKAQAQSSWKELQAKRREAQVAELFMHYHLIPSAAKSVKAHALPARPIQAKPTKPVASQHKPGPASAQTTAARTTGTAASAPGRARHAR